MCEIYGVEDEQPGMNAASNTCDTVTSVARHALHMLLVCLLPLPLLAATPERISVVYSIDSIPFQYTDDSGEPNGIIIDYWKLWSEKTGIAVDFTEATWNKTLALARDGKVDAHAGLFFNAERDRFLDYGVALTKTDTHVFYHNSIGIPADISKLSAYRIGVLAKDFVEGYLQARVTANAVVGFPDYSEIMARLQSGELKVFAADTPTGLFHLARAGLLAKFHYDQSAPLYRNDWFVASGEGNTDMLELINQGMARISPDEHKRIARRWVSGMPDEASDAIIIAISGNYAPFSTIGIDGKPGGYLVDLWREWARRVGRDVEFRATKWADTLGGIKSGEADIHSGLFRSRERDGWLDFSAPFFEIETAVYFKTGRGDTAPLDALADVSVGVISDSFQEEYLGRKHPGKRIVSYADIDGLLTGLLLEEVEAAVAEVPEMTFALSRLGITGAAQQGDILFTEAVHAAVLEGNAGLLALIDRGMAAIPPDTLAAINDRWIARGLDWKSVITWVAPVIGGAILVIIFVAVWNRRLGREILERKRVEQALAGAKEAADAANRAKSAFLANMSHELRTPMNAILGYSEMLVEEAEDLGHEDFIPDLKKINQAGTHLLALINDVLDLSKIESGKMEAFAEDIDVGNLLDEVIATARPLLDKNGNRLRIERGEHLGTARQDLTKIRQSLFNLLSNAAKFTHAGKVTLSAKRAQVSGADWLTFAVSDTGIGIPEDKLDHVFEEFSQADESTTRDYGGTGLGLAISRRFCRLLGGTLTVTSQPGEGSTFTIHLPAVLPGSTPLETRIEAAPTGTGARSGTTRQAESGTTVLVIDDDPGTREIIERALGRDGIAVITATSGKEGLRIAHEVQLAAITLNVMMPDMDGWSVLRALKADPRLREVPVVMLTMGDDKIGGYSLGATDYLTKPVDREQLLHTLAGFRTPGESGPVLLVEDDVDTREVMTRILQKAGWAVIEAGNGREALHRLTGRRPAFIMLDLMMPVMDGFDFLLEMRTHDEWQDIPVIVLTAKDLTDEEQRILSGRVEQVLEKSAYSREQLMQLIRKVVIGG
jgi:signal transduction histidine kinase/DNA-binding response OmpR family regulator